MGGRGGQSSSRTHKLVVLFDFVIRITPSGQLAMIIVSPIVKGPCQTKSRSVVHLTDAVANIQKF